MDCGKPPEGAFAPAAHAGCLRLRIQRRRRTGSSSIAARPGRAHPGWDAALRATAAHSTLTLADTSSAQILPRGTGARSVGAAAAGRAGGRSIQRRGETPQGWMVEAAHDGYVPDIRPAP